MKTENACSSMSPVDEMPIWARLQFMKMIPETYFWDESMTIPRHPSEAKVTRFERYSDVIMIYYEIDWEDRIGYYAWNTAKDHVSDYGYNLTPIADPTTINDPRDGRSYHFCDLPGPEHSHHVPFPYATCFDPGSWVWENKYNETRWLRRGKNG